MTRLRIVEPDPAYHMTPIGLLTDAEISEIVPREYLSLPVRELQGLPLFDDSIDALVADRRAVVLTGAQVCVLEAVADELESQGFVLNPSLVRRIVAAWNAASRLGSAGANPTLTVADGPPSSSGVADPEAFSDRHTDGAA